MYSKECNEGSCSSCMNPDDCQCGCHVHPDSLPKHPDEFQLPTQDEMNDMVIDEYDRANF